MSNAYKPEVDRIFSKKITFALTKKLYWKVYSIFVLAIKG